MCLAMTPPAPTVCFLRHCWSPSGIHKYVLLLARQREILLALSGSKGGHLKAWEDRQMWQAILKHSPSVPMVAGALLLTSDAREALRVLVVALPTKPINQIVQRRGMTDLGISGSCLGISNMQPSSGSHPSMFDLFPVFLGRPPRLDVRGCESEGRSPSSLPSHGRGGSREWGSSSR